MRAVIADLHIVPQFDWLLSAAEFRLVIFAGDALASDRMSTPPNRGRQNIYRY